MAFNVQDFRSAMVYDGARPNLFKVILNFPQIVTNFGDLNSRGELSFMANSTQLPPSIIGVARQSYFGREVKFPGDRVFPDWSLNIVNDETFNLRNAFELWTNAINNNSMNIRDRAAINSSQYSTTAKVIHYGKIGDQIKTYNFVGLFPTQVDPINVAWNQNDSIEEFGVTFSYQFWEAESTPAIFQI
jgi:hypothetical protein